MKKVPPRTSAGEYLIYARRSTDDQIHQKNSVEYQVAQCQQFASSCNLPVSPYSEDAFCDNGVIQERHTAYKTSALEITAGGVVRYRIDRPRFMRLVALLSAGRFKGVICLCWDRLSRNPQDDAVIKDLRVRGVDIRFVQATYDNSSAGALHMDIDGMFAAHYSRVMSEKIRAANFKLRGEGKLTVRAPIGYLDRGSDSKPLDQERAPIVRRLFELYATGEWSFFELSRWANKMGLTTKPLRTHRTKEEILAGAENTNAPVARPVTEKTTENILKNPFYTGVIRHGRHELVEYLGRHEPLIPRDLFRRVQEVMARRSRSVRYVEKDFFTYRGLIRCTCGRSYSPYVQKGLTYYYVGCKQFCENDRPNLRSTIIDDHVEDLLDKVHFSDEEFSAIEAAAPSAFLREQQRREEQRLALERRRACVSKDLEYLEEHQIALLREGVFGLPQYSEKVTRLRVEMEDVEGQLRRLGTVEGRAMLDVVLDFSNRVRIAKSTYKLAEEHEKHRLFSWAFLELGLFNGNVASVSAKKGFESLLNRPFDVSRRPDYVFLELQSIYDAIISVN